MAKIELKTDELVGLLQKIQGQGQESPRRSAQENLGMFQQARAANPVQSPVAPGTITQSRRQADEQAKLQREQMAQQERLARLSQAPKQQPNVGEVASLIKATTDAAAKQGRSFSDVVQALQSPGSLSALQQYGLSVDDAINLAKQYYGPTLQSGFGGDIPMPQATPSPLQNLLPGRQFDPLKATVNDYQQRSMQQQQEQARQSILESALKDFQQYSSQHQEVKEGTYRDPVTGEIYYLDKWGNKTYAGTDGATGTGGLGGLGQQ